MFLVATMLSIPLLVFYINGSTGNFSTNPSLETLLTLTTLGNLGMATTTCGKATNLQSTVQFFCNYGKISDISVFGTIDSTSSNSNCNNNGASLVVNSA